MARCLRYTLVTNDTDCQRPNVHRQHWHCLRYECQCHLHARTPALSGAPITNERLSSVVLVAASHQNL